MTKQFALILMILCLLLACKTARKQQIATVLPSNYGENKILIEHINSDTNSDKIVFLGRNNEVKIKVKNVKNSAINSQNILIISGDSNKIDLNLSDRTDNSIGSHDTMALIGNRNQLKIKQKRIIDNSVGSNQNTIILSTGHVLDLTQMDLIDDSMLSNLEYALIADDTFQIDTYYKAERIYTAKAKSGNAKAQFLLAKIYEFEGKCEEVEQLLTLSAEQGYLDALVHLADVYCYGYCGYKIDKIKALVLYKKAAQLGNAYAKSMVKWLD